MKETIKNLEQVSQTNSYMKEQNSVYERVNKTNTEKYDFNFSNLYNKINFCLTSGRGGGGSISKNIYTCTEAFKSIYHNLIESVTLMSFLFELLNIVDYYILRVKKVFSLDETNTLIIISTL